MPLQSRFRPWLFIFLHLVPSCLFSFHLLLVSHEKNTRSRGRFAERPRKIESKMILARWQNSIVDFNVGETILALLFLLRESLESYNGDVIFRGELSDSWQGLSFDIDGESVKLAARREEKWRLFVRCRGSYWLDALRIFPLEVNNGASCSWESQAKLETIVGASYY